MYVTFQNKPTLILRFNNNLSCTSLCKLVFISYITLNFQSMKAAVLYLLYACRVVERDVTG